MNTQDLSTFSFLPQRFRAAKPKIDARVPCSDVETRKIIGDMIAAGACGSEYGVQMLMSAFPDRF